MKDYLCGYCYEYAAILKEKNDTLTIECLVIPRMHTLVHAYCVDSNGNFYDVRGKFEDKEEFFSFFDVARHKEKREKFCVTHQFTDIPSFKTFLNDFYKDGISIYNEEMEDYVTVPFIF